MHPRPTHPSTALPRFNETTTRKTLAIVARWIERDCAVDREEALRMLFNALRRHGAALIEAWRQGRLHTELAQCGESYRLELVIGRQTLV